MGSHTTSVHFSSYDTSHYSYYNVNSSYPLSNAYTDSSSTSYAQIRWTRNANAQTYIYYKFALSIPSNATITSVTVKSKAYINTTTASRVTTRTMQLADSRDQTTFGSTLTIGSSATEQTFSNTGITWTPEKLNNLCVKFLIVRGTSNTTSSYNLQIYGGTVSVTYTLPDCTITTTNNTSYTFNVPASIESGSGYTITCNNSSSPSTLGLTVKLNGTDITSGFTYVGGVYIYSAPAATANQTIIIDYAVTYSVTLINNTTALVTIVPNSNISPGGYSTITIAGNTSPVGRYIITDNDTDITSGFISSGANYVNTIANINEDHVVVIDYAIALYINIGSSETTVGQTAYSGDSDFGTCTYNYKTVFDSLQVGDIVRLTGLIGWYSSGLTYRDSVVVDDTFTWDTSNTRTYSNSNYTYTITLPSSANYTIPTNTITPKPTSWAAPSFNFTIHKLGDSPWLKVSKAYKKVSGSWVEQSDLTTVFDPTKHYKKGN